MKLGYSHSLFMENSYFLLPNLILVEFYNWFVFFAQIFFSFNHNRH